MRFDCNTYTVKPVLSGHSKKQPKIGFQDQLSLNAGQKVLQNAPREHSAILSTCIKLPSVFETFILTIFDQLLKTGFTQHHNHWVLIKVQVKEHLPHQWAPLQVTD